jgi:cysteine desulfuration protein SufE
VTTTPAPGAGPDAIAERARPLVAAFAALPDWIERYRYLVALADAAPRLPETYRTEQNRLPGCQSGLWVQAEYDAAAGVLRLRADSDARITRGLAALLVSVLDGLPPRAIADADLGFLDTIGLPANLSSQRREGLAAMITELKRRARTFPAAAPPSG